MNNSAKYCIFAYNAIIITFLSRTQTQACAIIILIISLFQSVPMAFLNFARVIMIFL